MRAAALFLAVALLARGAAAYEDCEDDDIYAVLGNCDEAIRVEAPATAPSAGCCFFMQKRTNLACVCKKLDVNRVEKLISMKKMTFVAAFCGIPMEPGTQCGSYRVPTKV